MFFRYLIHDFLGRSVLEILRICFIIEEISNTPNLDKEILGGFTSCFSLELPGARGAKPRAKHCEIGPSALQISEIAYCPHTVTDHIFSTLPALVMLITKLLKVFEIGARCRDTGSSPPT